MYVRLFAHELCRLYGCALQTETDDVPLSLLAFQGRLLAGVGKALRIYDIGKKKLLRKVENKVCRNGPVPPYVYLLNPFFSNLVLPSSR
jgi:hypothetical protein